MRRINRFISGPSNRPISRRPTAAWTFVGNLNQATWQGEFEKGYALRTKSATGKISISSMYYTPSLATEEDPGLRTLVKSYPVTPSPE